MVNESVEPWMRGPIDNVPLPVMPLFFGFAQVREELRKHCTGLTAEQMWRKVGDAAPLGFHLRHIGGSVDRLLTYLEERQLSPAQLTQLKDESMAGAGFEQLYGELDQSLSTAEKRLLQLDLTRFDAPRYIGRKRLEVTALGLVVHIAEHTARHLGQAVTTAKLIRKGV
jgi:uncharacterized damage-inducible protein DinB